MSRGQDVLDGLYPAIVTSSSDPLKMGRVKVFFPWMNDGEESHWARVVRPYAGKKRGWFFMPEVGDEVMVAFELGDMNQPLVIGSSWNGKDEPPEPGDPDGKNDVKVIKTRSRHRLAFDDTPGAESIQLTDASGNNIVRWDTKSNSIGITALTGDIFVKAPQGKISLLAKDITVSVTNNAERTVGGPEKTTVTKSSVEHEGTSKTWNANTSLTGKATTVAFTASSSFSASGSSASVKTDQQGADRKFEIGGATTDTVGSLTTTATNSREKAASRTWNIGQLQVKTDASVSFDASGPLTINGVLSADVGGQFSLMGDVISVNGGTILMNGGQIDFNSSTPALPNPGAPGALQLIPPSGGGGGGGGGGAW
jgi:uncharacterized protein involved in type VI secretion and phage assembly